MLYIKLAYKISESTEGLLKHFENQYHILRNRNGRYNWSEKPKLPLGFEPGHPGTQGRDTNRLKIIFTVPYYKKYASCRNRTQTLLFTFAP